MQTFKTPTLPLTVQLAGDSIWDYEGPNTVLVTDITVQHFDEHCDPCEPDESTHAHIIVEHDTDWRIYTDSGFEAAISAALGVEVSFTEQGMQEDGEASMETD